MKQTVYCSIRKCIHNHFGICSKTKVHIVGMKCMDMVLDLSIFRNVKGKVVCSNTMCKYNRNLRCTKEIVRINAEGCMINTDEEMKNVRNKIQRHSRQVSS